MKLLLMASLMLGGGGVAATNEQVQTRVENTYNQVKVMVQKGFKGSMIERVKETGFPYPNETFLATLTDEQEALYVTAIDQINAEYDWANMTDEEIIEALQAVKEELTALREELGIEAPELKTRAGNHWNDEFVPKGKGGAGASGRIGEGTGDCPIDDTVDSESDAA